LNEEEELIVKRVSPKNTKAPDTSGLYACFKKDDSQINTFFLFFSHSRQRAAERAAPRF